MSANTTFMTHLHTEASSSVRLGRVLYQQAGASARERLKAAAQQRGVPVAQVTAKNSVLTHQPTGRTLRYGEIAAKAATIKLDKEPAIKTPDQYTLIGSRVRRFDVELKSRVQAVYGIDIRPPRMVRAVQLGGAPWRSTGTYANVFYLESFIEEMARAAGIIIAVSITVIYRPYTLS